MAELTGFVGPAYESRSAAADAQRLINLYCERDESGNGPQWVLYSTAGTGPFGTLPVGPIRGLWVGEGRLFCVAGPNFYEVFQDGSYNYRGAVANPDNGPAQIFPNGNQIMIIAGGQVYIDTGTALVQPVYSSAQGTLNCDGAGLLTLAYGDTFDSSMEGQTLLITIGGTQYPYPIGTYVDENHMRVAGSSPASGTNYAYTVANSGTVSTTTVGAPAGTTLVQWSSGDQFDYGLAGHTIYIGPAAVTVQTVIDPTHLIVGTSAVGNNSGINWYGSVPVTALCGAFLDSYFIVVTPSTKQINISQSNNGLRWDPADVGYKEGYPDNIVAILADHEELVIFGSQTTEVWRDTGNADFPFERDPGMFVHLNCGARWSVASLPDGPAWLQGEARGGPVCYAASGFVPKRVSTHALEQRWARYSTWTDAESFTFEENGHWFYQVSFPTAGETWVYDATAGVWHQRAAGSTYATLTRHRARNHAFVWNKHIVGDYSTGALYVMSSELTTDGGVPMVCVRRAPHVRGSGLHLLSHIRFMLLYSGAVLSMTLSVSDDYGQNWTTARVPDSKRGARGYPGRTLAARWNRLGLAEDRIYELVCTPLNKLCLLAADLEVK